MDAIAIFENNMPLFRIDYQHDKAENLCVVSAIWLANGS